MLQKLAQEPFQLARGEETQLRGKGKFRKKQEISLSLSLKSLSSENVHFLVQDFPKYAKHSLCYVYFYKKPISTISEGVRDDAINLENVCTKKLSDPEQIEVQIVKYYKELRYFLPNSNLQLNNVHRWSQCCPKSHTDRQNYHKKSLDKCSERPLQVAQVWMPLHGGTTKGQPLPE